MGQLLSNYVHKVNVQTDMTVVFSARFMLSTLTLIKAGRYFAINDQLFGTSECHGHL